MYFTSYHVAVYDTLTGDLIKNCTHQGYADHSMWARGQAWLSMAIQLSIGKHRM